MDNELIEAINIIKKLAKKENKNIFKIKELMVSFKDECSQLLKACKKDLVKKTFYFISTFLSDIKEEKITTEKLDSLIKKLVATQEVLNANKKYFQKENVKFNKDSFSKLCSLVNKTHKKLKEMA